MLLNLYSIFHLNLAFSSIEEEQRPEVIERCYWPLLRLIDAQQLPLGIEASGYTLEEIERLDPSWIAELKRLCHAGPAEFIGSGYAQLIGPLVPAEVNRWNQRLGLQVYRDLLDLQPAVALVSEQAYSAGLVEHYLEAGYRGIVMEWDNPSNGREDWQPQWRYLPQRARGAAASIPLLWNKSLPFQQFQRYAHGELELDEYLQSLKKHLGEEERVFSLYGNDAEIFDFRPGRFKTESRQQHSEWQRLAELFVWLRQKESYRLITPSAALDYLDRPGAGLELDLQTASQPAPVKKQAKYNITRWAVTGRDDLRINSACHRLCNRLKELNGEDEQWRELCYLWSSDFRTHITEKRWQAYLLRLALFEQQFLEEDVNAPPAERCFTAEAASPFKVERQGRYLQIETTAQLLRLNLRRGLAIESLSLAQEPELTLIGTLAHGYFDDIGLGADFYTGHLVVEIPGDHKLTDLVAVEPELRIVDSCLQVSAIIDTPLGKMEKRLLIAPEQAGVTLEYLLDWPNLPPAALRLSHITLNPQAFSTNSLFFACHNGGFVPDYYPVGSQPIDHLSAASPLVSANQGTGLTGGVIELGDAQRRVRVETEPAQAALTGHILFQPSRDSYLYRLILSARELDDTCSASRQTMPQLPNKIAVRIRFPS